MQNLQRNATKANKKK